MKSKMITRRVRQTGTLITVVTAQDLGLDDNEGEGKWYTICEEHSVTLAHRTKALANHFAPVPCEWCNECAEEVAE